MDKNTKMVNVLALGSDHTSLKVCLKSAADALFSAANTADALSRRHKHSAVMQVVNRLKLADTFNKISGVYGSINLPTTPAVMAKPIIIISHTVVAACARF